MIKQFLIIFALILGLSTGAVNAQQDTSPKKPLSVAVAASFSPVAEKLGKEFTAVTGIPVNFTTGSSQELLQQIKKGAQFDVYMSANTNYPLDLQKTGFTEGSPYLYALGTLALYAKGKEISHNGLDLLQPGGFTKLVIADPKNAPYGVAAVETLKKLEIYEQVKGQLVYADNALKAYEMVDSGQVEAGLISYGDLKEGQTSQAWIVPGRMHNPIKQAQVALKGSGPNAENWIKFMETDTAKNILIFSGYGVTNIEEVK